MEPRIEILAETKLVGKRLNMSFAQNRTAALWRGFMPERARITNNVGTDLYSVEVYPEGFFHNFDPARTFEKWAAIEVKDFDYVPVEMETLTLPTGAYAVFFYKGRASEGAKLYRYIFTTWLPGSEYTLDVRPHFALMGEKYKNDDPESEEEIWIPVKRK